jgi:hypothetical protein
VPHDVGAEHADEHVRADLGFGPVVDGAQVQVDGLDGAEVSFQPVQRLTGGRVNHPDPILHARDRATTRQSRSARHAAAPDTKTQQPQPNPNYATWHCLTGVIVGARIVPYRRAPRRVTP